MQRKANARWQGTVKEGSGTLSVQSGTLKDTPYSFAARFGDGKGTNPEELIAAAHAGCFTMALSFMLNNSGFTADAIDTEAALTVDDEALPPRKTIVAIQKSRTIIARNDSPDIPFTQSINPYQGCEHGCIYCYARPSRAYLDLSPGLDFETKLFAKPNAAELLRT